MMPAHQGQAQDSEARLRELGLAVCSLVHALSNALTLANGEIELALEMDLPDDARACLLPAAAALTAMTQHVTNLQGIARVAATGTPTVAD